MTVHFFYNYFSGKQESAVKVAVIELCADICHQVQYQPYITIVLSITKSNDSTTPRKLLTVT